MPLLMLIRAASGYDVGHFPYQGISKVAIISLLSHIEEGCISGS